MMITGKLTPNTRLQSFALKGAVANTPWKKGTYKITKCKAIDIKIARISQGFPDSPT